MCTHSFRQHGKGPRPPAGYHSVSVYLVHLDGILVNYLIGEIQHLKKANSEGSMYHSSRHSASWWGRHGGRVEGVDHIIPSPEEKVMNTTAQLTFSFLFSLALLPMVQCHHS